MSNSTVRGIHMMLHNALDRAVKERLILRNPTEDCIIPKIQKQEMKILHPEDMKAYLEAAEKRGVLPMFYLELVTGLRKGELTALLWSDLDMEHCTISISKQAVGDRHRDVEVSRPKTENSVRKISIPQSAVDLLIAEHRKHPDNPWMFPSPRTGEMYHPDSIAKLHEKILATSGWSISAFTTCGTRMSSTRQKKYNSEKQKTQATKIDLIAWVFCFCIISYSKEVMDLVNNLNAVVGKDIHLFNQQIGQLGG